jgi:hypothetical protein
MNARSVPPPRYGQKRRHPVGLWGSYLLGVPLADAELDTESPTAGPSDRG